ncbi:MAG: hypothetical protein CVU15_04645 [Betaproteobacteria bacterium HGW-Betaproteobacteria-1]|nr:MAG: hypothetical protein CVU15_04645 [Betaproteobacteria bacterium HGW-Betaproteobacteria-1]
MPIPVGKMHMISQWAGIIDSVPEKATTAIAFVFSLTVHVLFISTLTLYGSGREPIPMTIDANLAFLPPPPLEIEQVPPEPIPEDIPVFKVLEPELKPKPSRKVEKVSKGKALPVLAADGPADDATYTVPEIPPENVAAIDEGFGSAPESNTGSVYGSPEGETMGSAVLDDDYLWHAYGHAIQKLANQFSVYPEIARRRGEQGELEVIFHISVDGKLKSLNVLKSSGYKALDRQALEMVGKGLDALPVPASLRGREFKIVIPVEFKLR